MTSNLRQVAHTPLVWVVVVAWNNYADTAECLTSLRGLTYPLYRTVLVDNGSTDGTPERVRQEFPEVAVIESPVNLGVPGGYNIGFRYGLERAADYLLMLNNDTIVDPVLLDHLVEAAQSEPAGILVPIAYYYDHRDEIWSAGARYRLFPPAVVMEKRLFPPTDRYRRLEYAIGSCLLLSRRVFEEAGFLDETYFFMWEDLDLSVRVRAAGLPILQVPAAKLWHKVSRTTMPGSALFWQVHGEGGAIYYRRHSNYLSMAVHLGYFALREFVLKGRWYFLKPFVHGLRRGLARPLKEIPRFRATGVVEVDAAS